MQNQQLTDIQTVVEDVLTLAKQQGATQAEASMSKVTGISVGTRLLEIETLEFTNDGGLGISVYVGKRKGSASTADLSQSALQQTVDKAIQIARFTSEDPYNGLAEQALMITQPFDLDLYHPQPLDSEQATQIALTAEQAAMDTDPRITNSDGANYSANMGFKVYGNTHGVNMGYSSSRYSMSCVMIGEQDGDMQRDYSYTVNRKAESLVAPEQIGKEAADNTLKRLGARSVKTCKTPVIFHREVAAGLIGHFVGAISGGALYRKSSFMLDQLGKPVLPDWLSIHEKPHVPQGLASSAFDNEGVATQDMTIVECGVLNHYLYNSYSARKLGTQTNGHAGGIHNWYLSDTGQSDQQLLSEMGTGLLVTELMGQGVNTVTGDYSRGAAGYWVENGEIQFPVHEITIASNLKEMYQQIVAIGEIQESRGSIHCGSVLIESMQLAGN
jgi:PmbA protein